MGLTQLRQEDFNRLFRKLIDARKAFIVIANKIAKATNDGFGRFVETFGAAFAPKSFAVATAA